MFAAAAAPTRSTDLDSQITLISSPESRSLLSLIGCSRWNAVELPDAEAASAELARGASPIVICGIRNWRKVVEAARKSARPPGVIVVAPKANDLEWLQVLESGAHYMPVDKLDAKHLFSLLNLLWRGWHKD